MLDRRTLVKLGALTGAGLLIPPAVTSRAGQAAPPPPHHVHGGHGLGPQPAFVGSALAATPFSVPLPLPSTLRPTASLFDTDFYLLRHRRARVELIPGTTTEIFGYGGSYVGPTIRARTGRRVVIAHVNELDMPTSVHLHGGHVPASSDGHPMDLISPGATKLYHYPNHQQSATLWYHDHAHHMEAEHVYRGLHGFYLLEDPREAALRLPSGAQDVPIMLTDAQFAEDGSLIWVQNDFRNRNQVLVNGRPQPYLRVAARRYRLRLLNAANLRSFALSLSTGEQLTQIASDSGLLPAPAAVGAVALSPGERAEVVVDFSAYPVGTKLQLVDSVAGELLRFEVGSAPRVDASRVPDTLRPLAPLPTADTVRQVRLGLDFASGTFQIDGKTFDPDRVDATIKRGTSEIWEITNTDTQLGIPHNLHLHLVHFRVLSRDGNPPGPGESGSKDTVNVNPGEVVRVQATFGDYTGRYVYHCHLLDHSAVGMMAQMEIVA
ncbi:multicopper oxidase family protein [Asanoa sp. WMMD1127]|uniref:multicopper oxidase family protein n=1 Tax=Asanoa sp. WMMD1127 TaxID=3016107 RepID=UPI002417B572|nr:multicopper oxidase family protein [Asanoa sp. WMMD1127]MDG4820794.1 multicopper oxidase family protein [Asanoa sp. WMMD1127]